MTRLLAEVGKRQKAKGKSQETKVFEVTFAKGLLKITPTRPNLIGGLVGVSGQGC